MFALRSLAILASTLSAIAAQGLDKQVPLERGFGQIRVFEGQACFTRQPDVELESFIALRLEHPGDMNHLVEHDGIALDVVDVSFHATPRDRPAEGPSATAGLFPGCLLFGGLLLGRR